LPRGSAKAFFEVAVRNDHVELIRHKFVKDFYESFSEFGMAPFSIGSRQAFSSGDIENACNGVSLLLHGGVVRDQR
jgi:hypothetical protein